MATIRSTHRRTRAELSSEPVPRPGPTSAGASDAAAGAGGAVAWHHPARAVRWLWVVTAALLVVGAVVRIGVDAVRDDPSLPQEWLAEGARLVDLDAEANIPTFFSVMILAAVGVAFAVAAVLVRSRGARAWPLALPAVVGGYLSLDELASVHEQFGLISDYLGVSGGLAFAWVVPGAALALVVGLILLAAARRMTAWLRWRLVAAGVVYLTGAVIVETISSRFAIPSVQGELAPPVQSTTYVLLNVVEEGMEMAGALIALWAVLSVLRVAATSRGVLLDLDPARPVLRATGTRGSAS